MNGSEIEPAEVVLTGEVIEDEEYLKLVHSNLGIKEALASYLESRDLEEESVDILLAHFSVAIAETATRSGEIDVDIIRTAFEHLVHSMNETASRRHGYQPQSLSQVALTKLKLRRPQPKSYVRQLDDRYWSKQFLEQYENGGQPMAPRKDGETDEQYLARYIHSCMHGFLFAPFTYLK